MGGRVLCYVSLPRLSLSTVVSERRPRVCVDVCVWALCVGVGGGSLFAYNTSSTVVVTGDVNGKSPCHPFES
jgi:hypothetical protein